MTIFFSGQAFKYELEGICKLFLPLQRFSHRFDGEFNLSDAALNNDDAAFTRRKAGKSRTLLWVCIRLDGEYARESCYISNNSPDYESECERLLAILLFHSLQTLTKITPQWGILTGVRPVSILQRLRRDGLNNQEITAYFKDRYLVAEDKLELAFLTANTQEELLKQAPTRSYSLYVAIPFCVSRCSYCSFVSHAIDRPHATDKIDEYLSLLVKELAQTAKIAAELSLRLDTIYIGGGTPTALSAEQLKVVTDAIAAHFPVADAREYTIEAGRADTINRQKLLVIKQAGCKRISVNPQTFNDEVLHKIGRKHTAQQAVECFELAKEMGFSCINMDFIAGLPTDTLESFCSSINRAIALAPSNITLHTLSIKRSSELFSAEGISEYAKTDITSSMTAYAQQKLIGAGYLPYYLYRQKNTIGNLENVGYAKKGFESLYNVYIMDEMQTILACGAGGVTKLVDKSRKSTPIHRIFNYKYHFEYIDRFDNILKRKQEVAEFYAGGTQQTKY